MTSGPGISIQEIAQAVEGKVEGNETLTLHGAAALLDATDQQISFFQNPKYGEQLKKTNAGAVILLENTNGQALPAGKTFIRVKNPPLAFAKVLALFDKQRTRHPATGIHPRAVVDPLAQIAPTAAIGVLAVVEAGAIVGDHTIIYPGCYIGRNCRIADHCLIYPHVVLREDTEVGARTIIHAGAVLGADGYGFATQDGIHHKIPQIGRVVIEPDVEIGANVTIDRATTGETRIGTGTKIDNLVHIAHNVHIGNHCLIVAQVGISGSTRVGNQVTLAGQVGLVGHITIGDKAVITAQSGVINNVPEGATFFGTPARPHREAIKLEALFAKLPEIYEAFLTLKKKFLS